jgi:hypothetical protein
MMIEKCPKMLMPMSPSAPTTLAQLPLGFHQNLCGRLAETKQSGEKFTQLVSRPNHCHRLSFLYQLLE